MPVEIVIFSGSRQGEVVVFDQDEVSVGDDAGCDLFFDPRRDELARGKRARLRLHQTGWFLEELEGRGWLVNHQLLDGPTSIRSGDVIRLSPEGPDFEFRVTSRPRAMPAAEKAGRPERCGASAKWPAGLAVWGTAAAVLILAAGATVYLLTSLPPTPNPGPAQSTRPARRDERGSSQGAKESKGQRLSSGRSGGPTGGANKTGEGKDAGEKPDTGGGYPVQPGGQGETVAPGNGAGVGRTVPPGPAVEPEDKSKFLRQLAPALVLLGARRPGIKWASPLGSGCAIQPDLILTSASLATQLARFQSEGWKPMVIRTGTDKKTLWPIKGMLVPKGSGDPDQDPWQRGPLELALLTIEGRCPQVLELADAQTCQQLKRGHWVAMLGFGFQAKPLTEPKLIGLAGTVMLPPTPGDNHTSLLRIDGPAPPNGVGGPVVNGRGEVLGVFVGADPNAAKFGKGLLVNLAAGIGPVRRRLLGKASSLRWVRPSAAAGGKRQEGGKQEPPAAAGQPLVAPKRRGGRRP